MFIVFQHLKTSAVPDASGHVNEADPKNWEPFARAWAAVRPRGSREFFRGEQVAADITHAVEILRNSDTAKVTDKMRIAFKGRTLSIAEPPRNVDENDHTLIFACKEIK